MPEIINQGQKEMTDIFKSKDRIKLGVLTVLFLLEAATLIFTGQCSDAATAKNKDDKNATALSAASKNITAVLNELSYKSKEKESVLTVSTSESLTAITEQQEPEIIVLPAPEPKYSDDVFTVYDQNSRQDVTQNGFEMVCQIVRNEVGASYHSGPNAGQTVFHKETIKAHAVAAYSYLKYNQARGIKACVGLNRDISDTMRSYVSEVDGIAAYYNGGYICAAYTASTGGTTLSSRYCWGSSTPYLSSVESIHDSQSGQYIENHVMTAQEVKSVIEANTDIRLSDNPQNWFHIISTVDGNYVGQMLIDGKAQCSARGRAVAINGWTFREQIFGYDNIKSPAFTVSYSDGVFTFTSYGHGHGVGMPSEGAELYARIDNWDFKQILTHYYKSIEIK